MSNSARFRNRLHTLPHRCRIAAILVTLVACAAAARATTSAAPRPAIEMKLPPDIVFDRVVGVDSAVVFRHSTHVEYEGNLCTGCHPKLYRLLTPTRRVSHREMDARGSCGTCHDGKHAFDTRATGSCASCHAGRRARVGAAANGVMANGAEARPVSFKGPAPIVYRAGDSSPGVVTFRHATHLGAGANCRTCHPKPFAMASAGARPDGAMHEGSACGTCHDGKRSFGTEDDRACARCHVERKAAR